MRPGINYIIENSHFARGALSPPACRQIFSPENATVHAAERRRPSVLAKTVRWFCTTVINSPTALFSVSSD
ncbi:MAG: hypothetical protein R3A44_39190 [Caldilineaceae bacterium]